LALAAYESIYISTEDQIQLVSLRAKSADSFFISYLSRCYWCLTSASLIVLFVCLFQERCWRWWRQRTWGLWNQRTVVANLRTFI